MPNLPNTLLNKTLTVSEPALADAFRAHSRDVMLSLNCHAIGTIKVFNPANQTAIVSINYVKTFVTYDPSTNVNVSQNQNYPILVDAPVIISNGGSGYLTFPIEPGDECLVLFNDRDIDNWWTTGQTGNPVNTARLHSFSDALVLVGPLSAPNVLEGYDAINTVLGNGDNTLKIGPTGVVITYGTNTITVSSTSCVISIAGGATSLELNSSGNFVVNNPTSTGASKDLVALISAILTSMQTSGTTPSGGPVTFTDPTILTYLTVLDSFG